MEAVPKLFFLLKANTKIFTLDLQLTSSYCTQPESQSGIRWGPVGSVSFWSFSFSSLLHVFFMEVSVILQKLEKHISKDKTGTEIPVSSCLLMQAGSNGIWPSLPYIHLRSKADETLQPCYPGELWHHLQCAVLLCHFYFADESLKEKNLKCIKQPFLFWSIMSWTEFRCFTCLNQKMPNYLERLTQCSFKPCSNF